MQIKRIDRGLAPPWPCVSAMCLRGFGLRLEGATANRAGLKLGVQYAASDALTLAATNTSKTPPTLNDDKLVVYMSAIGLGRVNYRDVRFEDLGLPQEVGLGAALHRIPRDAEQARVALHASDRPP